MYSLKGYDTDPAHSLGKSPCCRGTQNSAYILFLSMKSSRWLIVRLKTRMSLVTPSSPTILRTSGLPFELEHLQHFPLVPNCGRSNYSLINTLNSIAGCRQSKLESRITTTSYSSRYLTTLLDFCIKGRFS